jgi:hypothetical protein
MGTVDRDASTVTDKNNALSARRQLTNVMVDG